VVFEKLTQDSIDVLTLARAEANRTGWDAIQPEHILLGFLASAKGIAGYALKKNGLQLKDVREQIGTQTKDEKLAQTKDEKLAQTKGEILPLTGGESSLSPKVEKILALSNDFAMDRNEKFIDTEHLLLALLEVKHWRTRDVFDNFGVDVDRIRADIDISIEHQVEVEFSDEAKEVPQDNCAQSSDSIRPLYSLFRDDAMRAVMVAQEEARKLGHNFVGSEQLLLGVAGGSGAAGKALRKLQITLPQLRVEVEKVIGRGSGYVANDIPLTPRGRQILLDARDQAFIARSENVGAEHILLALLESEGIAARVLENMRIDRISLRNSLFKAMKDEDD